MDNLTFCRLAVSKDKSRYNLCDVYRDRTELVATDGARLHKSNGLPEVAPHFVSGLDAEYPDWRQVLPQGYAKASVSLLGHCLDALTTCCKLDKQKEKRAAKLIITPELLTISGNYDNVAKVSFEIGEKVNGHYRFPAIALGINPCFFADALRMRDRKTANAEVIRLDVYDQMITLEHGPHMAVIMAMKLDK